MVEAVGWRSYHLAGTSGAVGRYFRAHRSLGLDYSMSVNPGLNLGEFVEFLSTDFEVRGKCPGALSIAPSAMAYA
jgi:hypothetical protein